MLPHPFPTTKELPLHFVLESAIDKIDRNKTIYSSCSLSERFCIVRLLENVFASYLLANLAVN